MFYIFTYFKAKSTNTGSQESQLGLLGAGMIAGLGLGYVGRRGKKYE
ncbi:LPXTG cell wall anchor domain-containing protein [Streptococcus hyovaginalis]